MSRSRPAPRLGGFSQRHFPPGVRPEPPRPGDFLLSARWGPASRLVRTGQKLRIHGDDRVFTHWTHAALVASETGDLIEVIGGRVKRTHVADFEDVDSTIVHVDATDADRAQAVSFGEYCLEQGHQLGLITFLSHALTVLTGSKFVFQVDGTHTCSGLVARSLERTGRIFDRAPSHVSPADLAKYFEVQPHGV